MRRSTCDYFQWEETHLQFSFKFNSMTYSQWEYGLTLTGDGRRSSMAWLKTDLNCNFACADPDLLIAPYDILGGNSLYLT